MKNSKRFSAENWLEDPFLTASQLNTCQSLFAGQSAQSALVVVHLTRLKEALEDQSLPLATAYLDPAEQERLASFRFAKRQLEWLGGRIAAKNAAMALLHNQPCPGQGYQGLRIDASLAGRPLLRRSNDPQAILPDISISHSGSYAGAVAVRGGLCGLDLQQISPQVVTVRERFASDAELNLISAHLDSHDTATVLSLLWSAKEALRKALACQPLAGFSELSLQHLTGNPHQGMTGHFSCPRLTASLLPVFLALKKNFACAITFLNAPLPPSQGSCK